MNDNTTKCTHTPVDFQAQNTGNVQGDKGSSSATAPLETNKKKEGTKDSAACMAESFIMPVKLLSVFVPIQILSEELGPCPLKEQDNENGSIRDALHERKGIELPFEFPCN